MRLTLERQLYAVLIGILAVFAIFQGLYYYQSERLYLALQLRGHTHRALQSLKSLAIAMYYAESQNRGYLLTKDPALRANLEQAIERIEPTVKDLTEVMQEASEVSAEERAQGLPTIEGLEALRSGVATRVELLRWTLKKTKRELSEERNSKVRRGEEVTQAIAGMVKGIEEDMTERLEVSRKLTKERMDGLRWLGLRTFLPAVFLLWLAALRIHSIFLRRDHAFE